MTALDIQDGESFVDDCTAAESFGEESDVCDSFGLDEGNFYIDREEPPVSTVWTLVNGMCIVKPPQYTFIVRCILINAELAAEV